MPLLLHLLLLSSLAACSGTGEAATGKSKKVVVDSSGGTVALGLGAAKPYRAVALGSTAALGGMVKSQTDVSDSVVAVNRDNKACGDSVTVASGVTASAGVPNALVWIEGVASGKPLPEARRETIAIEKCRFEPRVTAVIARSTVNVYSDDHATHQLRFYREGAAEPVAEIRTVDAGQVVPSEKIANVPGIVEVRCKNHKWVHGYVAVFDHPYFAVTDGGGQFKIDGLPAGTYTVKVWQERLAKAVEQRVVIDAGGAGRLDPVLALK